MTKSSDPNRTAESQLKLIRSNNSEEQGLIPDVWRNDPEEIFSTVRGYHVMAIVLFGLVLAAIVMCYITWRLRYKIVLRVKDPTKHKSTVVQNLLAQTALRGGLVKKRKYYEPRGPMRLESWEATPQTRVQGNKAGERTRRKQTGTPARRFYNNRRGSTGETYGIDSGQSRENTFQATKNVVNKNRRFSRMKSIKLSSGLTVPTEIDMQLLSDLDDLAETSHPLNLSGYGTS
ncbi:hypothetical protein ACHWQZ_G016175 [Mnemiopsis leidyi]